MVNNPIRTQRARKPLPHTKTRKTEETEKTGIGWGRAELNTLAMVCWGAAQTPLRFNTGAVSLVSLVFLVYLVFLLSKCGGGFSILVPLPPTMANTLG